MDGCQNQFVLMVIKNATTKPAKKVADGWYCALHADVIASQKWEATIRPGMVQARAAFSISDTNPEGWLSVRMRVFNETGNAQHVHVVDIRQKDFASEWLATVQATSIRSEGQTFGSLTDFADSLKLAGELAERILGFIGEGDVAALSTAVKKINALNTVWTESLLNPHGIRG